MKTGRLLFLSLFLLTLLFAILVGGRLPYFVFYIAILSTVIPLIHILVSLKSIKGYINIPEDSLYTGDDIEVNYRVDNHGFLSIPYLEIQNEISKKLSKKESKKTIISLEKKDSYTKRETIHLSRRGYYKLVAIKVFMRDVFNIYSFKRTISTPSSLLVYPKAIEISNFSAISSQASGELVVRDSTSYDPSSIESFRDYSPGDTIKAIHWKLTGKFDKPIVKEYEKSGDTNVFLILDNSKDSLSADIDRRIEDKSVDTGLSIVNYCLRENIKVSLNIQDEKNTLNLKGQEIGDLKSFLEVFARLGGNGHYPFKSFIQSQTEYLGKNITIILLSPILNREIAARILDLKMKGINIIFILITDIENKTDRTDLSIQNRLEQEAIALYRIDYKNSIKEILEGYDE